MPIEYQATNMNVDFFCGIVDVYNGSMASFSMVDDNTVNVKHRIAGAIMGGSDIEV